MAMDVNPRHLVTASVLSDHFVQVPLTASSDFLEALGSAISTFGVDTYLPLLPEEALLAAALQESGEFPRGFRLLAGTVEAAQIAADKWRTSQWLQQHQLTGPQTALAADPFEADRFFLKPRCATGSRGARVIDAGALRPAIAHDPYSWIVQDICESPEVTVDAFYDPQVGHCTAIGRERIETKSGVSTKARLFYDEALGLLSQRLAQSLSFAGSFCFQVMQVKGEWGVIDINLRPGAASAMCALTGNDFFAATFARAWRQDYARYFRPLKHDVFVTRQYTEFITG